MARRNTHRDLIYVAAGITLTLGSFARADIPAGYTGKPFDPAVAGGPKIPAGVKAGPYTIPGRLDFVNYDLGGDGVAYHTGDHLVKGGAGYRSDTPTATLSVTSDCIPNVGNQPCTNVWYDTSAALDGTPYPSATTADFSIGSVQDGDWFNLTVNVETTGTYAVSSTWATGNGPPGGEGGNGDMGLEIFSNGTNLATWTAVFPNYDTEADFHHWMAYPSFATVVLTAGLQVIKLQSGAKHLQLDYVEFALVSGDGGVDSADGGGSAAGDAATSSGATSGTSAGASGSSTASGASGSQGVTTGAPAGSGSLATSGAGATGGSGSVAAGGSPSPSSGAPTSSSGGAPAETSDQGSGGKGCALAAPRPAPIATFGFALAAASLARLRKRLKHKR
jgi:hypothetical protein